MKYLFLVLSIAAMALLAHNSIARAEIAECRAWQKQSTEYALWYAADWQQAQCSHYNITLQ